MPREERVIVKNMHAPLVDRETFDIVQDMIASRRGVRTRTYDWLLKGLIHCKECGKKLSLSSDVGSAKKTFYLRCSTYAYNPHLRLCTMHNSNLEKTTDFILEQIKQRCRQFLNEEKYRKMAVSSKDKILADRYNIKGEILVLQKKIKELNGRIDQIYEDKYNGVIQGDDFIRLSARYIDSRKTAEARIIQLEQLEEQEEAQVDITQLVKDFAEMKEITRAMLISLVDKVEMSQDKEITIYYKFNILNETETQENNISNAG